MAFRGILFPAQMSAMQYGAATTVRRVGSPNDRKVSAPWLVFSDDWGRHPTSCQHLIRHLLPQQSVLWANMIGTRRPALDLATARRGFEKLGQWLRRDMGEELPTNLQVVSPSVWPGFARPWERRFNRAWLQRQLQPWLDRMPEPPIAITTMPTAADLVGELPVARWVYYCVDDFSTWPGVDQAAARVLEDRLIDTADILVAASEPIQDRIAARGRTAHLLTHGVDVEFWSNSSSDNLPPSLRNLSPPFIVFWGLIDRRLDIEILRAISASLTRGTIVLIGPEDRPDPALSEIPRLVRRPALPLADLPTVAAHASVLVMPYADAPVTQAMQPLKLKEYLATGKPAVVRDLPANRNWSDCLDLAATPAEFVAAVRQSLAGGLPASQRHARQRLASEDWSAKAAEFARLVRDH